MNARESSVRGREADLRAERLASGAENSVVERIYAAVWSETDKSKIRGKFSIRAFSRSFAANIFLFCPGEVFRSPDFPISAITRLLLSTLLSSITCNFFGRSGQLSTQHTITSHPFGLCHASGSSGFQIQTQSCTRCHCPRATLRMASQSGNSVCILCTVKPSLRAARPKANTTPASFTGAYASSGSPSGSP